MNIWFGRMVLSQQAVILTKHDICFFCEISNTEVIAKELTILPNMIFASFVTAYKHWSPLLTTRIAF